MLLTTLSADASCDDLDHVRESEGEARRTVQGLHPSRPLQGSSDQEKRLGPDNTEMVP